jgi:hypothetical protein
MKMGWQASMKPPSRALRWAGIGIVALATIAAGGFVLVPATVRGLVRLLELTLNGGLWLAASISSGADAWTIIATVGRAVARSLVTPGALGAAGLLLLVGAGALFGLQRLLDSEEEESSR